VYLIYAEFMRAMHHLAGARYFYIIPYGMGVDNEEALRSGAFWFYRKMGFRPTNPDIEALARSEEAIIWPGRTGSSHRPRDALTATRGRGPHVFFAGDCGDGNTKFLLPGDLRITPSRSAANSFPG